MSLHVQTIRVDEARGAARELYESASKVLYKEDHPPVPEGKVPKYVQAWSLQPELARSWLEHGALARRAAGLDTRRYELLCVRVAYNLKCASVLRNHGWILLQLNVYTRDAIIAMAHDWRNAPLDAKDKAMLSLADQMCARSHEINAEDIAELRESGYSEQQIVALIMLVGWRVSDGVNGNAFGLGDGDEWTIEMQAIIDWK